MRKSGWHHEDIKAAIRKKYGSLIAFVNLHGIRSNYITAAIKEPRSQPLERLISEGIGVPLHELWPDRWLPDGRAIGRSHRSSSSRRGVPLQRQNGAGA